MERLTATLTIAVMRFGPSHILSRLALSLTCACISASALALLAQSKPVHAQAGPCVTTTAYGEVNGVRRGGACVYLGVPYAASTAGNSRWTPPQPRAPWSPAVLNATVVPPTCPLVNTAGALAGSEDCLTLNIWAPAEIGTGGVPVMVWLHTGGFTGASSNFAGSDGQRFAAERRAIVVAPNYRLGPFGFLAHDALGAEDPTYPSAGDYGFADQRAALRWVRDNIARFGGDSQNVTLAGTSAGATSVGLHLVSPASRGLFQRAIIQSGYPTPRLASGSEAQLQGDAFAAALGCTDRSRVTACMRAASRDQVLRALPLGQAQIRDDHVGTPWGPVVDGVELPDQPRELFRRGLFPRVPLIIGTNGDEGFTFVDRSFPTGLDALQYERTVFAEFGMDADAILRLYPATSFPTPKDALARLTGDAEFVCEARRLARAASHEGARVYRYSFDYVVDAVAPGRATHGLESNLLFGNNFATPMHVLTAPDLAIFEAMSAYWRRFMETGDPNPPGVPVQWPPFLAGPDDESLDPSSAERHFVFGDRLGVSSHLRDSPCNFWEPFFLRSLVGALPAAAR